MAIYDRYAQWAEKKDNLREWIIQKTQTFLMRIKHNSKYRCIAINRII